MASPNVDSTIPKNEPLVNAIQLSLRPLKSNQRVSATRQRQAEERNGCIGKSPDVPGIIHELEMDLNRPLKYALGSIFNNGGKMVLTFPGADLSRCFARTSDPLVTCIIADYEDLYITKLTNVAEDLRGKLQAEPSERSIFSWVSILHHTYNLYYILASIWIWYGSDLPNLQFPDIDVEVIQILTTSVPQYVSVIVLKIIDVKW